MECAEVEATEMLHSSLGYGSYGSEGMDDYLGR